MPRGIVADDFYSCGSWKNLTSLTLNNIQCTPQGLSFLAVFLFEHHNVEVLHFDSYGANISALADHLLPDTLPRLKELGSSRKFANAILSCKTHASRPLQTLKGVKLSGYNSDQAFLANLARIGGEISRVELAGWREMDDLRKLLGCVPKLTWLDVGDPRTSEYAPNKSIKAYKEVGLIPFPDTKLLKWGLGCLGDVASACARDNDILRCEAIPLGYRYRIRPQ